MTQFQDNAEIARQCEEARTRINRHFRPNPASQMAHDARCAAAVVLNAGGTMAEAMFAAIPSGAA